MHFLNQLWHELLKSGLSDGIELMTSVTLTTAIEIRDKHALTAENEWGVKY